MGARPECKTGFGFKITDPVAVYKRFPGWELQEGVTEEEKKGNWEEYFPDSFYDYICSLGCVPAHTGHHFCQNELDPEVETYILHKDTVGWTECEGQEFPYKNIETLLEVAKLLGVEYTPQLLDWQKVNYIG